MFLWISASFNYYLISYYMKYVEGSLYLNNILSQVAELFGYLISGFVINRFGLKRSLMAYFGLAGLFGFGLIFT